MNKYTPVLLGLEIDFRTEFALVELFGLSTSRVDRMARKNFFYAWEHLEVCLTNDDYLDNIEMLPLFLANMCDQDILIIIESFYWGNPYVNAQ